MSHETCTSCDKPLRLCKCVEFFDGHKYIGPTDCAFCGEKLDDAEEQGPPIARAERELADLRTLDAHVLQLTAGSHWYSNEDTCGVFVSGSEEQSWHRHAQGEAAARYEAAEHIRKTPRCEHVNAHGFGHCILLAGHPGDGHIVRDDEPTGGTAAREVAAATERIPPMSDQSDEAQQLRDALNRLLHPIDYLLRSAYAPPGSSLPWFPVRIEGRNLDDLKAAVDLARVALRSTKGSSPSGQKEGNDASAKGSDSEVRDGRGREGRGLHGAADVGAVRPAPTDEPARAAEAGGALASGAEEAEVRPKAAWEQDTAQRLREERDYYRDKKRLGEQAYASAMDDIEQLLGALRVCESLLTETRMVLAERSKTRRRIEAYLPTVAGALRTTVIDHQGLINEVSAKDPRAAGEEKPQHYEERDRCALGCSHCGCSCHTPAAPARPINLVAVGDSIASVWCDTSDAAETELSSPAAPAENPVTACEHCNADSDEPCDRGVDHSPAPAESYEGVDISTQLPNLVEFVSRPKPGDAIGEAGLRVFAVLDAGVVCKVAGCLRHVFAVINAKDWRGNMVTLGVCLDEEPARSTPAAPAESGGEVNQLRLARHFLNDRSSNLGDATYLCVKQLLEWAEAKPPAAAPITRAELRRVIEAGAKAGKGQLGAMLIALEALK
jgi:hypothetical protein